MADETVTESENTIETPAQAATPTVQEQTNAVPQPLPQDENAAQDGPASQPQQAPDTPTTVPAKPMPSAPAPAPVPAPGTPVSDTPRSHPVPKPHAPSPAAFAKKSPKHVTPVTPSTSAYSQEDLKKAESFGRVDGKGTVFVSENGQERQVGEFPGSSSDEALSLYAHRFLDIKAKLDLFATRLSAANIKPKEIDESIKSLGEETEEPQVVGDIAALKTQYDELKLAGEAKKEEIAQVRRQAVAKAVAERTKIVEKAESLADSLDDTTNWRSTADKFRSLFDQWQQHQRTSARIDKAEADALWKRFSAARTTFNQGRRKWAQERDNQRNSIKQTKEDIIAQANELKSSTAWGETSHKFNELMDRWKAAGRAGRNEDDELWARFREAADTFFNARQADRDQMHSSEQENLVKKEELLTKAETLVPVKDAKAAKQARQALAEIQEQWDAIGYVPREDMRRIEGRLDVVDKQIKAVEDAEWKHSDPEADARKSSFEEQLNAQLAELNESIATETDSKKKAKLEAEKATKEQWLNAIQ